MTDVLVPADISLAVSETATEITVTNSPAVGITLSEPSSFKIDIESQSTTAVEILTQGPIGPSGTGGGSLSSSVDKSSFADSVDTFVPIGGEFNDSATDLAAGEQGIQRMTSKRAAHVNVRDSTGAEVSPLTDAQLRATPVSVSGSFFQTTQPVSAASLPLPTGAATGTKQDTGNTSLASIDTKTIAVSRRFQIMNAEDCVKTLNYTTVNSAQQLTTVTYTSATVLAGNTVTKTLAWAGFNTVDERVTSVTWSIT